MTTTRDYLEFRIAITDGYDRLGRTASASTSTSTSIVTTIPFSHSLTPSVRTHGVYQNSLPETSDQWTFVLKLASLWGFDTIRQIAIDHLKKSVSAVDRIVLAEMYDLDFESWSLHAMHVIVRRHRPISVAEGQRIGIEMALKLASVRERAQSELLQAQWKAPGRRPNVETLDFTQILRETFKRSSG